MEYLAQCLSVRQSCLNKSNPVVRAPSSFSHYSCVSSNSHFILVSDAVCCCNTVKPPDWCGDWTDFRATRLHAVNDMRLLTFMSWPCFPASLVFLPPCLSLSTLIGCFFPLVIMLLKTLIERICKWRDWRREEKVEMPLNVVLDIIPSISNGHYLEHIFPTYLKLFS